MTTQERVLRILTEELGIDEAELIPKAKFREDLGADDVDMLNIVVSLEDEFKIEIPDEDDVENIETVQDLLDYVDKRCQQGPVDPKR